MYPLISTEWINSLIVLQVFFILFKTQSLVVGSNYEGLATEVDVYIEIQKIPALGFILYNTIRNLSARASR